MAEKVTIMKLKVDLECEKCHKKVKKLLCKYPQIRDQMFDGKQNIVTITVVCCSPEKIRDKLCCKGGGSIKSIEIVEPPKLKPPEPEKKKEAEKHKTAEPEKKKEADKPKPKADEKKEPEKKKEGDKPKSDEKPKQKPPETKPGPPPTIMNPVPQYPQVPPPMAVPVGICVPQYEGRPVGPYGNEYCGTPQWYDGYHARPVYDSYGGRPCYGSRCDQYFSEENATGCTIM